MPIRKSTLPSMHCAMVAGVAMRMMAMSDVPDVSFMGMFMSETMSGTMMNPPPSPT